MCMRLFHQHSFQQRNKFRLARVVTLQSATGKAATQSEIRSRVPARDFHHAVGEVPAEHYRRSRSWLKTQGEMEWVEQTHTACDISCLAPELPQECRLAY